MHREYHPADMDQLRAQAFGDGHTHDHDHHHPHAAHEHHDHRAALYALTALMGVLIGGDVLFGWLGWSQWRSPGGVSLAFLAAVIGGVRIVYGALDALMHGSIGADVALAQACLAALVIGQPFVAAEVVFIALVGEVLEAITFDRTQRAIHRLLDQSPRTARVRRDGQEIEIPAGSVQVGDIVVVRPGEKIPVDGPILVGRSTVDQSALTGESIPIDKGPDDRVFTGTINQYGVIDVRAERVGHETTFGQVLKLVADARKKKAPLERAADRLARYFLPVVETVAGLTLLSGYMLGWPDVWMRAVAVLVVACPCALILATPAAVLAAMAWLARHGVLIKGGAALERLSGCDTFAFDKTGTLTLGRPEVANVVALGDVSEIQVLRLAATAESSGTHPLGQAVVREAARRGVTPRPTTESVALPGAGVAARWHDAGQDRSILVGNLRLLTERGVAVDPETQAALDTLDAKGETPLLVVDNGRIVGLIGTRDMVRPEAHDVIHDLKHLHFKKIAILTGDRASAAKVVAKKTHIANVESEMLPADKARWIEREQADGHKVAMVGDGINDAPALASAHVGIALGGIGSDLAAEAGDIIVLGEPLLILPDLVRLSRTTVSIIRQNIILFAFGLNGVAMTCAALGILGPVAAAILHQIGSLLVLLNAMRLLAFGDWRHQTPIRQLLALGDAIHRLDDRLDPGRVFEAVFQHWRSLLASAIVIGLATYATTGWTTIRPGEVGLVQRFGRHRGTIPPGPHLGWPPPFERLVRLTPDRVKSLDIGFRTGPSAPSSSGSWEASHDRGVTARSEEESLLLTGDGQFVELSATALYHLDGRDPESLRAYAYGVSDPDAALRPLAESVVRAEVGRRALEQLLTGGRRDVEQAIVSSLQRRLNQYKLGLIVTGVAFQDIHPPLPVVDAYRDVSRADSDRQRRKNEASAYRAEALAEARGNASTTLNRAEALKNSAVARASSESDSFRDLLDARGTHTGLTDQRLYGETLSAALAGKPKLLLDPSANRPRHLILRDLPGLSDPAALIGPPAPSAKEVR